MAQVGSVLAELHALAPDFGDMKNDHLIDPAAATEQIAADEWEALLGRLRSGDAESPEARVRRLRSAIARGEFQIDPRAIAERLIRRLLAP